MDSLKVGKAISYLRKKVGYTQKELADRIGVSDKAVSKWERGLGLPDTSIIGKIAILLDSDTDSLLAGDIIHHDSEWSGLLILQEKNTVANAGTLIYDKPLVYFLLSYFMLVGIKRINIVCGERDRKIINEMFLDGSRIGLKIKYYETIPCKEYSNDISNVMVVAGKTLIYGVDQTRFFQKAMIDHSRINILSLPKKTRNSDDVLHYDMDKKIVGQGDNKKLNTQYDYYPIPILFCPTKVLTSLKISDIPSWRELLGMFNRKEMYTVALDRGFVEMTIETPDDITDASAFVRTVQKACGMQLYCVEEIAWRRGIISREQLIKLGQESRDAQYGNYILEIANQ